MALDRATRRAIARYGPTVNHLARKRYGISGQQLLARLVLGESGGQSNRTSPAGAKGLTQFMPSSRQEAIRKYGVDPWANPDQAVHGAALHLQGKINGSTGLEGYNPGMPTYAKYILGQSAPGDLPRKAGRGGPSGGGGGAVTGGGQTSPRPLSNGQSVAPGVGEAGILTQLLQEQLAKPARAGSTTMPTPPSFAAGPTLARDAIQTTAPEPKKPDLSGTLQAVASAAGVTLPEISTQAAAGGGKPAGASTGGNGGKPGKGGRATVVKFDGKPVRSDFARQLAWARKHGWSGQVISGFRTKKEQLIAANNYGLQHYGPAGPLGSNHVVGHPGAVDVSDPAELDKILRRYPGKRTLIWGGPVIGDAPHFSPNGH